jgi:hypothetical protein
LEHSSEQVRKVNSGYVYSVVKYVGLAQALHADIFVQLQMTNRCAMWRHDEWKIESHENGKQKHVPVNISITMNSVSLAGEIMVA